LSISLTVSPIRAATGKIIGASKIARDISQRRQTQMRLEVSENRFRRLFEAAQDGILILDAASQKITHVNPFLTDLLDYPADHFLGKELWEIGFLRDKEASQSAMLQLNALGEIRYESLPLEDCHGRLHPVEMVANVYEEGHHRVIQCNIRDISIRSGLENLLRGQASELSDLHHRKDEFLAMLSHELRSPLAPIASALQLLGLQRGSENRIQQQARGVIERQLAQLQHLVDDLLEVSRITTGRVQLRRELVDVSDIVAGAVETVRPLIGQRRHELTVSLSPRPIKLHADAARLEQVLVNLLTNAAKYTEEGGHIWLSVELASGGRSASKTESPDTNDECILRVRDTGVGIAPALLPRIFDLFTQAERSLDRSQGGLGIGLALVHRLTELHGGTVEVNSTLGEGSEFIVHLPVMPIGTPEAESPAADAGPAAARPLRVLVVDDNTDTVLTFAILLKASGHDVRTAHDGPTGVEAALAYLPDVALLDIGLPGLNGYEVAKRIRQEPTLQNAVLVALTGYGQETDREISRQAGFNHHMVKPANFDKLQQILANVAEQVTPVGV
ncbi:MAG: response regulator, partial [Planctomycetales bacterium]|nr:response regulator [Planctomycetales bacterium]